MKYKINNKKEEQAQTFRFNILIDITADSLKEGYKYLYNCMSSLENQLPLAMETGDGWEFDATWEGWESTDEVYFEDGDLVPEEVLSDTRLKALQEKEDGK